MSNIHIGPVKGKKTYLQIVEKILNMISENQLEYGDRLFSEPELMQRLNVSRPTLRESLRVLEFLGIVSVGTRAGITINAPKDTLNYAPLLYIMMFEKPTNTDLFELRRAIQVEMAGVAAVRRTEQDCEVLKRSIRSIEEAVDMDYVVFADRDYAFHSAIVESTQNILGMKLMETMCRFMSKQLEQIIHELTREQRLNIVRYHTKIYEAIAGRRETEARRLMEEHLERPYHSLKKEVIKFTL